jgi:hypothetical protein
MTIEVLEVIATAMKKDFKNIQLFQERRSPFSIVEKLQDIAIQTHNKNIRW